MQFSLPPASFPHAVMDTQRSLQVNDVVLEVVFGGSRVDGDAGVFGVLLAILLVLHDFRGDFLEGSVVFAGRSGGDVGLPHHDLKFVNYIKTFLIFSRKLT